MKLCTKSDKYFLLSRSLQGDQQTHNASEGREREHTDCYYLDVWDLDNVSSPAYVQCIATHFIAKSMWWNFESTTIKAEYHISQHIIRHAIWTNIVCMTFDWFGMVGGRKKVAYLLCLFWNSSQSIDKVCIVELQVRKFTRTKQPFVILFSCFIRFLPGNNYCGVWSLASRNTLNQRKLTCILETEYKVSLSQRWNYSYTFDNTHCYDK